MEALINGMLILWYLLTAGSLAFVVIDLFTNTPTVGVMKLAWILIVLYAGPVGLFIYLLSCRQPIPGTHDQYISAHWKQSVGSMMHCVAGDATGIILAAAVVFHFGLPNGVDLIIEYTSAFIVGLLVFQALFMRSMFGGDYFLAVRRTFFAETVSMNTVMIGMIPTMVILMSRFPGSDNPTAPLFWGIMSLSTMAGMITAYPINSWMVRKGLKHGMMTPHSLTNHAPQDHTVPMKNGVPSKYDQQAAVEMAHQHATAYHEPRMDHESTEGRGASRHTPDRMGRLDRPTAHETHQFQMQSHEVGSIPLGTAVAIVAATFGCLGMAIWVTSFFAEIRFS